MTFRLSRRTFYAIASHAPNCLLTTPPPTTRFMRPLVESRACIKLDTPPGYTAVWDHFRDQP